jgi:hypothetical protein
MKVLTKAFHEPRGLLFHGIAVLYGVGAYALGLYERFSRAKHVYTLGCSYDTSPVSGLHHQGLGGADLG